MEEHVNKGFGLLFDSRADAEAFLNTKCFPAPIGNVSNMKPDGSMKHRLIQDLKHNQVNRASEVPERSVAPRPVDHAVDMAKATVRASEDDIVVTLILDYENAS